MCVLHSHKASRSRRGFTLTELLIVVAIIALLIMLILPAIGRAKELARRVACAANVRAIAVGLVSYAQDNDDAVPLGCWLAGTRAIRRTNYFISYVRPDQIPSGCPVPDGQLGMLIQRENEYIDHAEDFYCPSAMDLMWKYNNPTPEELAILGNRENLWWENPARSAGIDGRVRLGYGVRPVMGWPTNGRPPWDPINLDQPNELLHNNGKLPRISSPTPINYRGQRMMISFRATDAMLADVTNNPKRVNRFHVDGVNVGWFDGSVHWFDRSGFSDTWHAWTGNYSDTVADDCHYRATRDATTGKVTVTGVWADIGG